MLPEVDVIFAILNMEGLGIADGSKADMEDALAFARYMGERYIHNESPRRRTSLSQSI